MRFPALSKLFAVDGDRLTPTRRLSSLDEFRANPRFAKSVRARWICSADTFEYLSANDTAISRYGCPIGASLVSGGPFADTHAAAFGLGPSSPAVWRLRFASGLSLDVDVKVSSTIALTDGDVRVVLDSSGPLSFGSDSFDRGTTDMTGQCVLVVDDNDALRRMFSQMLEAKGYKVLSANGALGAWTLMSESPVPVDLLLTDVQMPGLDGWELGQLVLAQWPWLRVLYMSADPDALRDRRTETASTDTLLPKPFTSLELLEAVQRALRGKASQ